MVKMSELENSRPGVQAILTKRYEVQFQKDRQHHSDMNDLDQAKHNARSLANWNFAAQVYDRVTHGVVLAPRPIKHRILQRILGMKCLPHTIQSQTVCWEIARRNGSA